MLDGKPVGTTPLEVTGLLCGHTVRVAVAKDAFDVWQRALTTREGERLSAVATLRRPRTVVSVTSEPPGAQVMAGGRVAGLTPLAFETGAFTRLSVEVRKAGFAPAVRTIVPRPGAANALKVSLSRSPAPLPTPDKIKSFR
jgi:hypothetical protein